MGVWLEATINAKQSKSCWRRALPVFPVLILTHVKKTLALWSNSAENSRSLRNGLAKTDRTADRSSALYSRRGDSHWVKEMSAYWYKSKARFPWQSRTSVGSTKSDRTISTQDFWNKGKRSQQDVHYRRASCRTIAKNSASTSCKILKFHLTEWCVKWWKLRQGMFSFVWNILF